MFAAIPHRFRAPLLWILAVVVSTAIGFLATAGQAINIDDNHNLGHGAWLLYRYGLGPQASIKHLANAEWYGPLFDVIVVAANRTIFASLQNEFWVLRALTFTLFPLTLFAVYRILLRAKLDPSTAVVAIALLIGMIRFGGHAIVNQKDFPFACAFLVATLYTWVALREIYERRDASTVQLIGLGAVAILPFLIRPVPPLHVAIVTAFLYIFVTVGGAQCRLAKCFLIPLIPGLTAAVLIGALYPALRDTHPAEWVRSFGIFSAYPWFGSVRAFGMDFDVPRDALPRWYVFAWLPVIMNPIAFFFLVVGLVEAIRRRHEQLLITIPLKKYILSIGFTQWLLAFVIFTWSTVVILQPNLYDEERHLLFLYPPVAILAAMGFRHFAAHYRVIVASIIIFVSGFSYAHWQYFSYVYKNPLVVATDSSYFMGDYWGICTDNAIRALYEHVPAGTRISLQWLESTAGPFLKIINDGHDPMFAGHDGPPYWMSSPTVGQPHAFIGINRLGEYRNLLARVYSSGPTKWELVWREEMPPNDTACVLIFTKSFQG